MDIGNGHTWWKNGRQVACFTSVLFSFVFAFSKGELRPHIGGIVVVVVWGAPPMVVGISKRRRGGQASHLQIYKRRG